MSSQYISRFNGPPGFSVKQPNDNNLTTVKMGMPLKPETMSDGSIFSSNVIFVCLKALAKERLLVTEPDFLKLLRSSGNI